jgi:hypothetical protein
MTEPDPTTAIPPTNVQVYESNPESLAGAALDRSSSRRLPVILVAILVVAVVVALGRRRRAAR